MIIKCLKCVGLPPIPFIIRSLRNDTLKNIGKGFGIDKNSTVGSVVARVKREMEKDENISKRVNNLKYILGKSQEQI